MQKNALFVLLRIGVEFLLLLFLIAYTLIFGNFWISEKMAIKVLEINVQETQITKIKRKTYSPSIVTVDKSGKIETYHIYSNIIKFLNHKLK